MIHYKFFPLSLIVFSFFIYRHFAPQASAYEAYDRLSPAYARFIEGLTAYREAKRFVDIAERLGNPLREGFRGNPLNVGPGLEANHPLVRTNPITGWKGLFVNKGFTKRINELTSDESEKTLTYLFALTIDNHDRQVRFKRQKNDVAIWSNTSTVHRYFRLSWSCTNW